jgi:hypothetical protein
VGFRQRDDWPIENRRFHGSSHHSVAEKDGDTTLTILRFWITEILLELIPVHSIICFEESKIREQSEERN